MKTERNNSLDFKALFESQVFNQMRLLDNNKYDGFKSVETNIVPVDDPKLYSYHMLQLMSELGEVLEADKRWKNFRNDKFKIDEKASEIADCFIVLMNIAMFSGLDAESLYKAISDKIEVVKNRIEKNK